MNQDFFTTVVRNHSGDKKAQVNDFVIKPSLAIGEHCEFCCNLVKYLTVISQGFFYL